METEVLTYVAFLNDQKIALGELPEVASKIKKCLPGHSSSGILIFNNQTGKEIDLDWRGSIQDVLKRLKPLLTPASSDADESKPVGPGRPKLGVVSREISLLPRHWEWLSAQPGGASVTLRKLVEEAKKKNHGRDKQRQSLDATYRFLVVMAGDRPGFEEAVRALYAKDQKKFKSLMTAWPKDIREHALALASCEL